jgi:hypothetical protein
VAGARGQLGNLEEVGSPPLEAVAIRLAKTVAEDKCVCKTVI